MLKTSTRLEWGAFTLLFVGLILNAISFVYAPNSSLFDKFAADTNGFVTPHLFAVICFGAAAISCGVLWADTDKRRRNWYQVGSGGLLIYPILVAVYLISTHTGSGNAIVYYVIVWLFSLLTGWAVWR